jgi:type I restriction enzyme, S subunit
MWQLNSVSVYRQGETDTVGATSPHVNVSTIRNYRLAAPDLPEQHAIAAHLDTETAKIDRLISETEDTITLMQERRSALISVVVTGKLQVPGIAEPSGSTLIPRPENLQ